MKKKSRGGISVFKKLFIMSTVFTAILLMLAVCTVSAEETNIIKNPGFEEGTNGSAKDWSNDSFRPEAAKFTVEEGTGHTGKRFYTIENIEENDSRIVQELKIVPGKTYKIGFWYKAEGLQAGAGGVNIAFPTGIYFSPFSHNTDGQWKKFEMYLKTHPKSPDTLPLWIRLGGYGATTKGKLSVDDVSVELAENPPASADIKEFWQNGPDANAGADSSSGEQKSGSNKIVIFTVIALIIIAIIVFIEVRLSKKRNQNSRLQDGTGSENKAAAKEKFEDDDDFDDSDL
ncbi:MAG: carbohydrate binding domain-containing protein [Clostridia bacterium]|nr:carbohydrate binding domain-containing protein [Clostridia bacterium]